MKKILLLLYLAIPILLFSQSSIHSKRAEIRERMATVISHEGKRPVHNFMLYIHDAPNDITVHEAVGTLDKRGDSINPNYQYNIASITKTMVATVILQLAEEGKLDLDDPISTYLADIDYLRFEDLHNYEGKAYANDITIYHLLRHQSGLGDIFLDTQTRFNISVLFHKKRMYSPKRIMDTFFKYKLNDKTHFKPGEGSYYTDINFLLLGLIIEQVSRSSLPQQIRGRILEPLGMEDSYFEYYEPHIAGEGRITAYLNRIQITHKINTSYEWGGGGIVSTVEEMGHFIQALFEGALLKQEASLKEMIDISPNQPYNHAYGLGIYKFSIGEDIYYGHGGFYGSLLLYNPDKQITLSANVSQANTPFDVDELLVDLLSIASPSVSKVSGK